MTPQTTKPKRAITHEKYVSAIGEGDHASRSDLAEFFSVSLNTATYHLEKAVEAGLLVKEMGFISHQPGWLYSLPSNAAQGGA